MARITVASYNVHYGHDQHGRAFDVVQVCKCLDADLLVLQESWLPADEMGEADRAATELGYTAVHIPMGPARISGRKPRLVPEAYSEGQLVISMLSRLPVRSTAEIEIQHMRLDTAPRRFAIRTDVEVEGSLFSYFGTHLDHLTHGSPVQLSKFRRGLPGPEQPAGLAGDMNMWGPVLSTLMPGWTRAVKGRTWPNGFPHSQIDHILVNRSVQVESGEVLYEGRSDHLPIRAVLNF